jgi:glycine/D-amino acid oxidase-like deaminating enzyme
MRSAVVVGAGCFGSWTALHLARAGFQVTLVEAYGPGNSRASSGGETRVTRMSYGPQEIYTRWSLRSLDTWKELFARTGQALFHPCGVLWLCREQDPHSEASLANLVKAGVPHERLTRGELERRWPQIDFGPVAWGIHEPESGLIMARRSVGLVAAEAVRSGARYVTAAALPPAVRGRLESLSTAAGERLTADVFVFACGPWLPKLFPILAERIFPTRQEVFYFGPPPGDARFAPPLMPVWMDQTDLYYGLPDVESKGFKIALDRHGDRFDPDTGERLASETLAEVRDYVGRRFPALAGAPLVASEVCQYENTSNGDFLIDRHPEMENVWMVGGGSGHGFKHGPAVGEYVARVLAEGGAVDERFSLATKETVKQRAIY